MLYPDGSTVHVGDLIWWNEGVCVGYVHQVIESSQDQKTWDLEEPSVLVGNSHPFDPSGGWVMYGSADMEDEGIGKLSASERDEFDLALQIARHRSKIGFENRSCRVSTRAENCELVEWIFDLLQDDVEVERIVVPHGTGPLPHDTPV